VATRIVDLPGRRPLTDRVAQTARVLRVVAAAEFKVKYTGSALGYVWSVLKPLALFSMLYLVFGHIFKLGEISHYYPMSLLIGIVLFTFLSDATTLGMWSLVNREALIRKLAFPRLIIPTAATLTGAITFCANALVVVVFLIWNQIVPQPDWLLVIPLLLELYLFVLGLAFILSALLVRLRDIGQVWELVLQLLFYASPIIYPIGFLPYYLRKLAFINPFTQVLQDIRALVLYPDLPPNRITVSVAFGTPVARLIPVAIAIGVFALGLYLFRRDEPWMAERV
jgi:ABC-2 type transport system permease protein